VWKKACQAYKSVFILDTGSMFLLKIKSFRLCSSSSSDISSIPADGVVVVSGSSLSFCGEFVHR
jgi:hypothetical protein